MRTNEQPKTIQKKIKLPTTPRLETTITKIPNNRLRMLKCIALFLPGGDLMKSRGLLFRLDNCRVYRVSGVAMKQYRPEDLDRDEREYNRREKEITDFYTKLAENARN